MTTLPFEPRGARFAAVAVAAAVALWGCGGTPESQEPLPEDALGETGLGEVESEIRTPLTVTELKDPLGVGKRASTETRVILRTAAAYRSYFGHPAPASVNFAGGDVVLFYAAGVKSSGGYTASIASAAQSGSGKTLFVTTRLTSPGPDCTVTMALTTPYVLAKVTPKTKPVYAQFKSRNVVKGCGEASVCAATLCPTGTVCKEKQVQCITAPCPPVAECVPVTDPVGPCATTLCAPGTVCKEKQVQCVTTPCEPIAECVPAPSDAPFCGGIAGIACPGAGTCRDDPNDSCDPKLGGADCGGRCACEALGSCAEGYVWNDSPSVCACEKAPAPPSTGVKCGSNTCGTGEFCCNASCGICAPKGGACIQLYCGDEK